MTTKIKRPEIVTDEHLQYLDDLRSSGRTNMWGAAAYLRDEQDVPHVDSKIILSYWMESFDERHNS